jgi:hypothetical protein
MGVDWRHLPSLDSSANQRPYPCCKGHRHRTPKRDARRCLDGVRTSGPRSHRTKQRKKCEGRN